MSIAAVENGLELLHKKNAEIDRLRASLEAIASLGGKTLLGPAHDTERHHARGAASAFEQAAEIARTALEE